MSGQSGNQSLETCVHTLGANDGYTWNDVSCDNCYNYTCVQGKSGHQQVRFTTYTKRSVSWHLR